MRVFLICLLLFTAVCYSQKTDGWKRTYIVFDDRGIEVAKRFSEDSSWVIGDPKVALEKMYQEKIRAEEKYKLAMGILKNIGPDGSIKDKGSYFTAVKNFNSYK